MNLHSYPAARAQRSVIKTSYIRDWQKELHNRATQYLFKNAKSFDETIATNENWQEHK